MKYFIFLFALLLTGCKKEAVNDNSLPGKWELASTTAGLTGKVTSYPPGQGNQLVFNAGAYTETRDHEVIREGKYSTSRKESVITKKEEDFLIYEDSAIHIFFTIADNKLQLNLDAYDSGGYTYRRID